MLSISISYLHLLPVRNTHIFLICRYFLFLARKHTNIHTVKVLTRGVELKLAKGGRIIMDSARENFSTTLVIIFAPLWAYFSIFSLYIVRMAKSSGGASPP